MEYTIAVSSLGRKRPISTIFSFCAALIVPFVFYSASLYFFEKIYELEIPIPHQCEGVGRVIKHKYVSYELYTVSSMNPFLK